MFSVWQCQTLASSDPWRVQYVCQYSIRNDNSLQSANCMQTCTKWHIILDRVFRQDTIKPKFCSYVRLQRAEDPHVCEVVVGNGWYISRESTPTLTLDKPEQKILFESKPIAACTVHDYHNPAIRHTCLPSDEAQCCVPFVGVQAYSCESINKKHFFKRWSRVEDSTRERGR